MQDKKKKQKSFTLHLFRKINISNAKHYVKKGEGFTLIELLVVISIIGLLSSIVLVATKGARGKARIAAGLQFSASIHHALGAYIVGEWKFEEGDDNTCGLGDYNDFCDTSGNENHGQNVGDISRPPNSEIPQLGRYGKFGAGDEVKIQNSDSLEEIISNQKVTVELWLYPEDLSNDDYFVYWEYNFALVYNSNNNVIKFGLRAATPAATPVDPSTSSSLNPLKINKWHHIVGTYNGSEIKIFVNGKQSGDTADITGASFSLHAGFLHLGEEHSGFIDEVRIYSKGLTPAQIQKLYAEGARKRGLLVEK